MLRHLTLLLLVVGTVAACADPAGPSSDGSRAQLEQQRTDVRASTRAVVDAVTGALGGTLRTQTGKYDGCRSAGPESYDSFQYTFRGRIDVTGPAATRPYLDQVEGALVGAGLTDPERGERSGGMTLAARDGDVEVRLSEFPDQGAYVIVDALGPCVDTPTDDSDYWIGLRADRTLDE